MDHELLRMALDESWLNRFYRESRFLIVAKPGGQAEARDSVA